MEDSTEPTCLVDEIRNRFALRHLVVEHVELFAEQKSSQRAVFRVACDDGEPALEAGSQRPSEVPASDEKADRKKGHAKEVR